MEPKEIEFDVLESKYFNQLYPDDCIHEIAATMAVDYHYRSDYSSRTRMFWTVFVMCVNIIITFLFVYEVLNDMEGFSLIVYIAFLALWLFFIEFGYRIKNKKPDRLQYFFLSGKNLFVNNQSGEYIIPYNNIKKINKLKYVGKEKKIAVIEIYAIVKIINAAVTVLFKIPDLVKIKLYVGADNAERIYNKLVEMTENEKR